MAKWNKTKALTFSYNINTPGSTPSSTTKFFTLFLPISKNLDAYTTDDIKYQWKEVNPIQQKAGLRQSLPSFELQEVLTDYCTSKTNTG